MNLEIYENLLNYVKSNKSLINYSISNINESKCTLLHNTLNLKVILDTKTFKVLENKETERQTTIGKLLKGIK